MKAKIWISGVLSLVFVAVAVAAPLGTEFWYTGFLGANGKPASGNYDFQAELYDDSANGNKVGNTLNVPNVAVANGAFQFPLDFGSVFDGTQLWLKLLVKPSNGNSWTTLSPRQLVTASPYALFAPTAGSVAANGVVASSIQNSTITANKIASGQVVKSLNGLSDNVSLQAGANVALAQNGNALTISSTGIGWGLTGNAGTTPGVNFLGTTDNQPLELKTANARGLRLERAFSLSGSSINLIGGASVNGLFNNAVGATIAGGGEGTFYGDFPNQVGANFGTIGGGEGNTVTGFAGTVPGGSFNQASGYGAFASGISARAAHDGAFVWNSYGHQATSFSPKRFHVFAENGFSVDYDVQRDDGGGAHWAGIGVFPGQTFSTWTGAYLEDNGDWHCQNVVAYGPGNEQAYLGGDGWGNDVQVGSLNPSVVNVALWNAATSSYMNLVVATLTITGGADLAEPFPLSQADIAEGSVVVIDAEHPGELKLSASAYDTHVAGVVSGANGVHPGISLKQQGRLEGGKNIALSGRVYVRADASSGPIQPGDLLTSSSLPGHAMKAGDHVRAQGAILGKAMGSLDRGQGLVLTLVTLQ